MKAMVLAAGRGTRLRPLTDNRPKALVEIGDRTLLDITLSRLRAFGIHEVIINVHHFSEMIAEYLKANRNFGMRVELSHEDVLLDTGGGVKKAAWFFLEGGKGQEEAFLLHNVDVISTIDFRRMFQFHNERGALVTLAVQSRESSRLLLFDDRLQLCGRAAPGTDAKKAVIPSEARNPSSAAAEKPYQAGVDRRSEPAWAGRRSAESAFSSPSPLVYPEASRSATRHSLHPLAFSGIHVISPRLLRMMTEDGAFSIITTYLRLAGAGEKILAFRADEYYWRDLGRTEDLTQAAQEMQQKTIAN